MTLQANQEAPASPSPPSQAEQLQSEFRDRLNKGLQRTTLQRAKDELAESEVVEDDTAEERPAPAPKASPSSAQSTPTGKPVGGADGKAAEVPDADADSRPEGEEKGKEREAPKPKFDSRNFGSWITKNPEDAAELAAKHFKVQLGGDAEGWKKHFIAFENKRRRMNEGFEKREAAIEAERTEVKKLADDTLGAVQPILDVIEAESKGDFPAIDLFIEQAFGISFNEYCTRRLRGSSKETAAERAAKLKAEKLEKELAELKAGKAEPAKKEERKAPKVSESWISSELSEDHGVRDLKDWAAQVEETYQDSYDEDTEEYALSIEDAADRVLTRFLKKRGLASDTPAKSSKPKPKRKPARVHDDEDEERTPSRDIDALSDTPPDDLNERTRWALARAARRR